MALPSWLDTGRLVLRARIFDWLDARGDSSRILRSLQLAEWLRSLRFQTMTDSAQDGRCQLGSSCGLVAADVVHSTRRAEEERPGAWWRHDAGVTAVDPLLIARANEAHTHWSLRPSMASDVARDAVFNYYLDSEELLAYLAWREEERGASVDSLNRVRILTVDASMLCIGAALHAAATERRGTGGPEFIVVQTPLMAEFAEGVSMGHFFVAAYEIAIRPST